MTLSAKLKTKSSISEEDLILKGGSSGKSKEQVLDVGDQGVKRVQLRIPQQYLDRIGSLLDNRAGNVSRHTWLIEAIVEKLGKEEKTTEVNLTSSQP